MEDGQLQELDEKARDTFPYGAKVLPPGPLSFKASVEGVYEDSDGRVLIRVWPNDYKDLSFEVANYKEQNGGWLVEGPQGPTLLKPLTEENRA